ncbi:OST-HTH/LOTUS domain-containing protein [Nitratifractor salsuginis]|uniref:Cold-shock protein DNA-binding protein n=1 Tax=Nitratifractor salsuginis (strain DSM 16511 / JCM 12458 / E9I37-1) TaxID=749222 RepID=E6X162_NITSE|nr:OST-HTH/LOTUS domain-containing protein [Nitratifractor salsuginis]ADV45865.1 Cold-shock protein DNA-binding protein [Nitratifractor salsuginis DSM 16511]
MNLPDNFFHHDAQGFFLPDSHSGINVENIGRKQNTLIEGIRGTGKTHVLKMIQRNRLEQFGENRILPVYLSVAKISEHAKKDPDIFRMYLYGNLVREAISIANINKESLQPNKTLLKKSFHSITRMFGISANEPFDRVLDKINVLSDQLFDEFEFGLLGKYINKEQAREISLSKGGNIKAGVSLVGNNVDSSLSENKILQNTERSQEGVAFLGKKLSHNDAVDFLITFLKQLQVILDLDYTLLLIDECSEAPKNAQIEIFRLLKTIRGADSLLPESGSSCAYFVASVYPKSHTYYPTIKNDGFNFEPGHDFTTNYLQWDVTDNIGYEQFFKDMLINRAKSLLGYSGTIDQFIHELFDKKDTFLLAIYSSHGIPRRFWEILKRAYYNGNGKIRYNNISNTILGIAQEQLIDHNLLSEKEQDFIQYQARRLNSQNAEIRRINRRSRRSKPQNIFFEINRNNSNNIQSIIMVGAMHDMKRIRAKKNKSIAKPLYALDIAIAFSLKSIPEGEFIEFLKNELHRNATTNFTNALSVLSKHFIESSQEEIEELATSLDSENDMIVGAEEGINKEEYYGTIEEVTKYSGIILPDDEEKEAVFQISNIGEADRKYIQIGDRVIFNSSWVDGTRVATNIRKINVYKAEGTITKIFKDLFGTITILEDGTEAFFLLKDADEKLEKGDFVEFSIEETNTNKRKAYNIRLKDTVRYAEIPKKEIVAYIYSIIDNSDNPVSLADLGNRIINKYGDIVRLSHWFGHKKLMHFIASLDLKDLHIDNSSGPGYISYKKIKNNSVKIGKQGDGFILFTDHEKLINKLSNEIGIPKLSREEYKKIFRLLKELIDEEGYTFNYTAKRLRDVARKNNIRLNRVGSNFILRGIVYAGHWFEQPEDTKKLQQAFYKNTVSLIEQNNFLLDEHDSELLKDIFDIKDMKKKKLRKGIRIIKKANG